MRRGPNNLRDLVHVLQLGRLLPWRAACSIHDINVAVDIYSPVTIGVIRPFVAKVRDIDISINRDCV